ncbi:MAG: hypothetical protein ACLP4R_06335 [Solirubrobacteraceae bacterium]
MITRAWRGWTARENAGAYEQFLLSEFFPTMRDIAGFRGAGDRAGRAGLALAPRRAGAALRDLDILGVSTPTGRDG